MVLGIINTVKRDIKNSVISPRTYVGWSLLFGVKVGMSYNFSDNLTFSPGVHFQIDQHLYNKADNLLVRKQWVDSSFSKIIVSPINGNKTGYNLGGAMLIDYKNSEILLTYNAHLRGRYTSHQGSVRLKYLF